jgi:hypothetical protein
LFFCGLGVSRKKEKLEEKQCTPKSLVHNSFRLNHLPSQVLFEHSYAQINPTPLAKEGPTLAP